MSKTKLSSRERMLAALSHGDVDYTPCCFMIFGALSDKSKDQFDFVERQLELGLDATVDLPLRMSCAMSEHADLHGLPVHFDPDVKIREWREDNPGERYPILHKEYSTPGGVLTTAVQKTDDWPYGDHVPFLDDFLIPRSKKPLIATRDDLKGLPYLLTPTSDECAKAFCEASDEAKRFAKERDLLVTAGWGAGLEIGCWLCGIQSLVLLAMDDPDFVEEMVEIFSTWNRHRMEIILAEGVDLFIRRGWYEGADFWSPSLYRKFVLPSLREEVKLAHEAGAKFGYIMTSGLMPISDLLLESGIDVLIGIDPVQGKATDLQALKQKLGEEVCLWGGVNGFVTVERGAQAEVKEAVHEAIQTLAPGGGFILSPVDNVRDTSDHTWENVQTLIEMWKEMRGDYAQ